MLDNNQLELESPSAPRPGDTGRRTVKQAESRRATVRDMEDHPHRHRHRGRPPPRPPALVRQRRAQGRRTLAPKPEHRPKIVHQRRRPLRGFAPRPAERRWVTATNGCRSFHFP
jgi:hypothetical protein